MQMAPSITIRLDWWPRGITSDLDLIILVFSPSVQINHTGALLCPVSETEEKRQWAQNFKYTNKANKGKQDNTRATSHVTNLERKPA